MNVWLHSFHFLRPIWLLVIPFAVIIYVTHSFREDIRAHWKKVIAPDLLEHLIVKKAGGWTLRPIHMICFVLILDAIAIAGPTWRREQPPFTEDKAPLVIALDLSQTMDAIDLDPTRLERAKLKIHDLLSARNGGRTALFVYGGSPHLVVPLTSDNKLFSMYLDALSTSLMPKPGKNTSEAITAIQNFLRDKEVPGTVLFVTDGIEPKSRPPLQKFVEAGKDSALVLGVGTSRGAPIRTSGNQFLEDANGRRVFSKLDIDALKSLSALGVPATTLTLDDSDVQWILHKVQSHLQSAQEKNAQTRWIDEGYWLVLPIAVFAALWFRKGWTVQWSGGALMLLILFPHPTAEALRHRFLDLWMTPDQQGRYYFEKGNYHLAATRFENPMWKGLSLSRSGDYASALDQFSLSDSAEAWYNQGNALAHLQKFPEAVHAYEQALQRRPGWLDAEENLRLVRSLIPPPKKADDEQELPPDAERGQSEMEEKGDKPADFLRRRFAIQADEAKKSDKSHEVAKP